MNYRKGAEVLPARLLEEIQQYIDGGLIYIPKKSNKAGWGHNNGTRQIIDGRNTKIISLFEQGETIEALADRFHLSEETIRKIVYRKKQL